MYCPLYGKTLVKKPVVLNVYKQKTPLLGETIQVTKNTMKNLLQPYVKINQPLVLMKITKRQPPPNSGVFCLLTFRTGGVEIGVYGTFIS